jgi:LuxR family maltose regulon positive regulatory protein
MSGVLLSSKISVPPARSGEVLRPRLFGRLDAGLAGKLTLVSASPGSGKTTLISSWARQSGVPVAWLSLEPSDNDPNRFWVNFLAALQAIEASAGFELPGDLPAALPAAGLAA